MTVATWGIDASMSCSQVVPLRGAPIKNTKCLFDKSIAGCCEHISPMAELFVNLRCSGDWPKFLEPISKSSEEDNEAGELDEVEEVVGVVFLADEDATSPLYPSEEALDEPTSRVTAYISRRRSRVGGLLRLERCGALISMPSFRNSSVAVQWVASAGRSVWVSITTRSAMSDPSGGMREGRVLSRSRRS